jgi:DNA repair protein RadA/Sms
MNIKTSTNDVKIGTDIRQIHVPDKLRQRQDLGIDWVNHALGGGGMTPSTVGMLTGSPGSGKSTMMRQLADSITGQGHIAIYNTGEESIEQVKMRVEDMELTHGFQIGQETFVGKVLAHAREMQALYPKKQVFVLQDSLQTLDDGHYKNGTTSVTPVRCCAELTNWAKETYGIVLFIGQVTKSGVFAGKNVIRHMVDVHMEVLRDEDPKSDTYKRLLFEVSKNRFGYTGKTYVVNLGKKGLSAIDYEDIPHTDGTSPDDWVSEVQVRPGTRSGVQAKVTADQVAEHAEKVRTGRA